MKYLAALKAAQQGGLMFISFNGLIVACMIGGAWQEGRIIKSYDSPKDDHYLVAWSATAESTSYSSLVLKNRCVLKEPPPEVQSAPFTPAERRAWAVKYRRLLQTGKGSM